MWKDMLCGVIFVLQAEGFELVASFGGQRGTDPFPLGFEEQREGVSSDL